MNALEDLEAMLPELLGTPFLDNVRSVCRELRAAREAVETYSEEDELVYPAKQVKKFIAEKMKEAQNAAKGT